MHRNGRCKICFTHLLCGLWALLLLIQELWQPQALLIVQQRRRDLGSKDEAQRAKDGSADHKACHKAAAIVPVCPAGAQAGVKSYCFCMHSFCLYYSCKTASQRFEDGSTVHKACNSAAALSLSALQVHGDPSNLFCKMCSPCQSQRHDLCRTVHEKCCSEGKRGVIVLTASEQNHWPLFMQQDCKAVGFPL